MSKIDLGENNLLFTTANVINSLCTPLFERSPIGWFCHGRFFNDGRCFYFASDPIVINHLFEKNHLLVAPLPEIYCSMKKFNYLIPEDGPYQKTLHEIKSFFNIHAPFDIIERHIGYFDLYCFATKQLESDVVNYYFNWQDTLDNFILSYKENNACLLEEATRSCIQLSASMKPTFQGYADKTEYKKIEQADFLQQLNLNNLPIYATKGKLHLSSREIDCLKNILKGLSAKESAYVLNLSPRTVESYLYNIKNKFGLHKKSDLVSLAMSL